MTTSKNSANLMDFNSLLKSSFHPLTPVFVGSWRGQFTTKWRGITSELTYNTYLRNGWVVIDTGIKAETGTPIIEFSSWEPYVSTSPIILPNVLSYKFFFRKAFWRVGFLTRASRVSNEEWVSSLPSYLSILNNIRKDAGLRRNTSVTLLALKPVSFLLSRFESFSTFSAGAANCNQHFFQALTSRTAFSFCAFDRLRASSSFTHSGARLVSVFSKSYFVSALRAKLTVANSSISTNPTLRPSFLGAFSFYSTNDLIFKLNVIFSLYAVSKSWAAVNFLFDRALHSLLRDLVGLMLARNFSYNFAPKFSLNYSEFLNSLTGFVLRKCAFLLTFARLTFSAFLAVFLKFLSTALSRVVTRILQLLGTKNSLSVPEYFLNSSHKLYAYKFKQLWKISSTTFDKRLHVVNSYRLRFEDLVRRFIPRFLFPKQKQSEAKLKQDQVRNNRFWRRPFKAKRWLKRGLVGDRVYPVVRRFRRKPVSRFKLPFLKKQFSFLYFWTLNFFSFFSIEGPCKRLFGLSARLKFFFKTFLKFLKFYSFTTSYFKLALAESFKSHNKFLVKFNSLKLYFWWLLRRARSLLASFFSLINTASRRYYLSVESLNDRRLSQLRTGLLSFVQSLSGSTLFTPQASFLTITARSKIFAANVLFHNTYISLRNVSGYSDFDHSVKIRHYLRFTLLFRRALYNFFRQRLALTLSTFARPAAIENSCYVNNLSLANDFCRLLVREKLLKSVSFSKPLIVSFIRLITSALVARKGLPRARKVLKRFSKSLTPRAKLVAKVRRKRTAYHRPSSLRVHLRSGKSCRRVASSLLSRVQMVKTLNNIFRLFRREFSHFFVGPASNSLFLGFLTTLRLVLATVLRRSRFVKILAKRNSSSEFLKLPRVGSFSSYNKWAYLLKAHLRATMRNAASSVAKNTSYTFSKLATLKAYRITSPLGVNFTPAYRSSSLALNEYLRALPNFAISSFKSTLLLKSSSTSSASSAPFQQVTTKSLFTMPNSVNLLSPQVSLRGFTSTTPVALKTSFLSVTSLGSTEAYLAPIILLYMTSDLGFLKVGSNSSVPLFSSFTSSRCEVSSFSSSPVFFHLNLMLIQLVVLETAFAATFTSLLQRLKVATLYNHAVKSRALAFTFTNRLLRPIHSPLFSWVRKKMLNFLSSINLIPSSGFTAEARRAFLINRAYSVSSLKPRAHFLTVFPASTSERAVFVRPAPASSVLASFARKRDFRVAFALLALPHRRSLLRSKRSFKWKKRAALSTSRFKVFGSFPSFKKLKNLPFRFFSKFRHVQKSIRFSITSFKRCKRLVSLLRLNAYKFFSLKTLCNNCLFNVELMKLARARTSSKSKLGSLGVPLRLLSPLTRALYVRDFLISFARAQHWKLKAIISSKTLLQQMQERMFLRVRSIRKIRLRSNARRLGIFPKRNKKQKRMYWKLVNSGKLEPVKSDYASSGLSIFDRRNTRSMELSAETRKKKFKFYTIRLQFKLRKRLWAALILLVNGLRNSIRKFRTKLWRRRFYRIFRSGKWRLRKRTKTRFVRALSKAVWFLKRLYILRSSISYQKVFKKLLPRGSSSDPLPIFSSHNSLLLLRTLHLRFLRTFSARVTLTRSAIRRQFLKEGKFIFIYKFLYSFVRKLHTLFSHFSLLASTGCQELSLISAISAFGTAGADSFVFDGYQFSNTLLFRPTAISSSYYSDGFSNLMTASAFALFSLHAFRLGFRTSLLTGLADFYSNSFAFAHWRRATFVRRFAKWNWVFAVRRWTPPLRLVRSKHDRFYLSFARMKSVFSKFKTKGGSPSRANVAAILKRMNFKNSLPVTSYACFLNKVRRIYGKKSFSVSRDTGRGSLAGRSLNLSTHRRKRKRRALKRIRRATRLSTFALWSRRPSSKTKKHAPDHLIRFPSGQKLVVSGIQRVKPSLKGALSLKKLPPRRSRRHIERPHARAEIKKHKDRLDGRNDRSGNSYEVKKIKRSSRYWANQRADRNKRPDKAQRNALKASGLAK